MKKLLSMLLVVAMLVSAVIVALPASGAVASAAISGTVRVTDPQTGVGTLKVTLKLDSNPGLNTLVMSLGYNADVLEVKSVTNGAVFTENNNGTLFDVNTANNPLVFYFEENNVGNITATGNLVVVEFEITDAFGNFDITVDVDETNTFAASGTTPITPVNVPVTNNFSYTKNTQHVYTGLPTVVQPTCTEAGYTKKVCNVCGNVLDIIPGADALGHDYYEEVETEPTCTEKGVLIYTCDRCGDTYTEDIDPLGHDYQPVTVPATYEDEGYTADECTICQDRINVQVLPILTVSVTIRTTDENGAPVGNGVYTVELIDKGIYTVTDLIDDIPGFTKNPADPTDIEIDRNNPDTLDVSVVYVPNTDIEYTVQYVDENGNKLLDDKTVTDRTMRTIVTEKAAEIEGYTPDEAEKSLQLDASGNVIVFTYTKNAEKPVVPDDNNNNTNKPAQDDKSPLTGDNMIALVIMLAVAVSATAAVIVIRKRRED